MKRLHLLAIGMLSPICTFAQRDYRAMPEDFYDFGLEKSITEGLDFLSLIYILVVILFFLVVVLPRIIAGTIKTRKKQKNEIKERIKFSVMANRFASTSIDYIEKIEKSHKIREYFVANQNIVLVPGGSECIILEYLNKENRGYVKVLFEEYPDALYMQRKYLLEASQREIYYYITTAEKVATINEKLCGQKYAYQYKDKRYYLEEDGYVLIPCGAKFTPALDVDPKEHYTPYHKVIFEGFPIPLYINYVQTQIIPQPNK